VAISSVLAFLSRSSNHTQRQKHIQAQVSYKNMTSTLKSFSLFAISVLVVLFMVSLKYHSCEASTTAKKAAPEWPASFKVGFNLTASNLGIYGAPSQLIYDFINLQQRVDYSLCPDLYDSGSCSFLIVNNKVRKYSNRKSTTDAGSKSNT